MSDRDRSRIKPPQLHIKYAAREIETAAQFESHATFRVNYINSRRVSNQFWAAWEACMGIFVSLAGVLGVLRWHKWVVRTFGWNDP
jgi:hypothetical protein